MKDLTAMTREFVRSERLIRRGGRAVVAVSGGVDSVVLLEVLFQVSTALGFELTVAHVHHGLRPEADGDEEFVRQLALERQMRFRSSRIAVADVASQSGESVEMAGHRLRHAFLASVALEVAAPLVVLAHHADDQAELVLLRLLRGAGGEGIGGMRPLDRSPSDDRVRLFRPFLEVKKKEIIDFARQQGLEWREDVSNGNREFLRNRVRNELLPSLERDFQPGIRGTLARSAAIAAAESELTTKLGREWLKAPGRRLFEGLHVAVQRAVIRQQAWALGVDADFESVERLRLTITPVSVPGGIDLVRLKSGKLERWHPHPGNLEGETSVDWSHSPGMVFWGGTHIRWSIRVGPDATGRAEMGRASEWFDADRVGTPVRLRHWRPGDRFHSLGLPRPARLQNLFVNRKVPGVLRRELVVAETNAGVIFWVESLPPGEPFKVTSVTRRVLEWACQRPDNPGKAACA